MGAVPSMLPTFPHVFPYQEIWPGHPFSLGAAIPGVVTFPPATPTRGSAKTAEIRASQSGCTVTSSSTTATMFPEAIRAPASTGGI